MRKGQKLTKEHRLKISKARKKLLGSRASNWRGGKMMLDGYVYIYSPFHPNKTKLKYVAEHRLVVEKALNRFISKNEIVHHINGIKTDNRIENLVLCASNSSHQKYHKRPRDKKGRFI